jgi:hypothetical protein
MKLLRFSLIGILFISIAVTYSIRAVDIKNVIGEHGDYGLPLNLIRLNFIICALNLVN